MELIIFEREIVVPEIKNVFHSGVDAHSRKRKRLAAKLQFRLLKMIIVQMHIAERVNEITSLKITNLCNHHRKQRIRSNIERHSQENIRTTLVELATQFSFSNIELEHGMAWHQCHLRQVGHI